MTSPAFVAAYASFMAERISRDMASSHVDLVLSDDDHHIDCRCFGDSLTDRDWMALAEEWQWRLDIACRVHQRRSDLLTDHDQRCVCFSPPQLRRFGSRRFG